MSSPSPGATWVRRCVGLLLVVPVAVAATACRSGTGDATPAERAGRDEARAALASHPTPTRTRIHRVHGRLPDARRKVVRAQVGAVVDRWWEAAFLGGSYPREAFPSAFPGFTAGAEERARDDKALLTNQPHGARIESVSPERKSVRLDILATGGRARTVTAQFVLRFATTGERAGTTTVRGRLFLIRQRDGWRIFGYDVAKGAR